MIARTLAAQTGEAVGRAVRALGSHRYVAGRLHLVHAFVLDASREGEPSVTVDLSEAMEWAAATLADPSIDRSSRDERLWRRATDRELAAALATLWGAGPACDRARDALERHLTAIGVTPDSPSRVPFDETGEEDIFPLLIDAGWELLPLASLDPERHKGVIQAFGDPLDFQVAKFEEASLGEAPAYLHELPALGPVELLRGAPGGALAEPLTLWTEGDDTYHDYVLRGVERAAKLT
jgi:hypothetical protein